MRTHTSKPQAIFDFIVTANMAVKMFAPGKTFLTYSKIDMGRFLAIAERFTVNDINEAIDCIERNAWDQSEFIMATEGE